MSKIVVNLTRDTIELNQHHVCELLWLWAIFISVSDTWEAGYNFIRRNSDSAHGQFHCQSTRETDMSDWFRRMLVRFWLNSLQLTREMVSDSLDR